MEKTFTVNKAIVMVLAVVAGVFLVAAFANASTTISTNIQTGGTLSVTGLSTFLGGATTTSLTLLSGATIDNATLNQINLAGANASSTTRVGLIRAGFNGYGSEIGGSGYNPFTIAASGNRGGAELYYGYSGTTGDMRGLRVLLDNQTLSGGTTGTLSGAEIEARGNSVTGTGGTITTAQGVWAAVASKNDIITNANGVLSDLDTGGSGHVTTWKALDVTHSNTQGTVTTGYGLFIDSIANVTTFADISMHNGNTISNTASGATTLTGALTTTGALISNSALTVGTTTLSGGTAAVTVTSNTVCVVSDTQNATSTKGNVAGTTLTITGGGNNTDIVAYICL